MQITTDVYKILETVQGDLIFILNVLSESSIYFAWFLPRMLLVSHKMVFNKSKAALLCETMREGARTFAATI